MTWLGGGIGPGIKDVADAILVGDGGGDPGPLDPFEKAQFQSGSRHRGPGVAGTDDSLGLAALDEVGRDRDGRLLFLAESPDRGLVHRDCLGRVQDLDSRITEFLLRALLLDHLGVADKVEFPDLGEEAQSFARTGDCDPWGLVPAHGIDGDFHGGTGAPGPGSGVMPTGSLEDVHVEDLALPVESAGRAGDMAGNPAFAFRTGLEQGPTPAIGTAPRALLHFRRSAFWDCHGEKKAVRSVRPDS